MEISKPSFASRNFIWATVLGLLSVAYWLTAWQMHAEIQDAVQTGFDGEMNGMVVIFLRILATYTSLFFLAILFLAVKRNPKSLGWELFVLALFPTLLLVALLGFNTLLTGATRSTAQ